MKRLATKGTITLASAVFIGGLAFIALLMTGSGPFSAHANPGTHVGIDTITTDNTSTSLGIINACLEVSNSETFDVDLYGTELIDLRAFEAFIEFDKNLLTVTGNDVGVDAVPPDGFPLLDAQPGSSVTDVSETPPDTDGIYLTSAYDLGTAESGSGVLARLTLQADPSQTGISNLDFFLTPNLTDANLDPIPISRVIKAAIAVGTTFPDVDVDTVPDPCDNCPDDPNSGQEDDDDDGDGNVCDNCPAVFNPDQADWDGNGVGDACEDYDLDGIFDAQDNCPSTPNPDQTNTDASDQDADTLLDEDPIDSSDNDGDTLVDEDPPGDALGDACDTDDDNDNAPDTSDNCPLVSNPDQTDTDSDTLGDTCDPDDDEDGFVDSTESFCGSDPLIYTSTCEVCDEIDNDGDCTGDTNGDTVVCGSGDLGVDEGFDRDPVNGVPDCSDPAADTDGDTIANPDDPDDDDDGDPDPGFNDAYPDALENWMGTDSLDPCPDNPDDEAWPSDFNNSGITNITDVVAFAPVLGTLLGGPAPKDRNYDRRFDLNASSIINITDVVAMRPTFNTACN